MAGRLSPRFGPAATILGVVAALAILLEVGRTAALAAVFAAWALFAALELVASRRPTESHGDAEAPAEERQPVAGAEPFAPAAAPGDPSGEPPLFAAPFDESAAELRQEELLSTVPPHGEEPPADEERAG